ncbi:MAG: hypothetical protein GY822_06975 [Deltaproteobacteria bacterium]|nr:hypothetical protein [Deltaproteobacteria bacterium]
MVKILELLPQKDLTILVGENKLKSSTWVPFQLQGRLLQAIDQVMGEGDHRLLFEVGTFMAQRDVPRAFRPLLRLGNPGWIVTVGTRMWRTYHSEGWWEVERSRHAIIATLHDHHENHGAFCATFGGWVSGAVELSGGKDVMFDHPICRARGGPHCVITGRWS